MREIVIYTVGASKHVSFDETNEWREAVVKYFTYNHWVKVININKYYNYEEKLHASEKEIADFCLRHACKADVVICNLNNFINSKGGTSELTAAYLNNVPIIGFCDSQQEDIYTWDLAFCDRVFYGNDAFNEAIKYVDNYYVR